MGDPTIREEEATIRDDGATIRDAARDDGATIRDAARESGVQGIGEFQLIRALPVRGAEADLYLVRDAEGEKILKVYRPGVNPDPEIIERCERVSRECPEHVVGIYGIGFDAASGRWRELMEYIPNGSVADWLERGGQFDFQEFVAQLTSAVKALHERGVVHRDLKPANILIRSVAPLDLVLTDFGVASALDGASVRETSRGGLTPMYAAPEDMLGKIVSRPADWWACGMIFYELLAGGHPLRGLSANRILYILSAVGVSVDESLPARERTLLAGLLTRDDKKRWAWPQIEAWLAGRDDIPVHYDRPASDGPPPFGFLGQKYASLPALAAAFASGFREGVAGEGALARGNVASWLRNANLFDEETVLAEEVADDDPEIYLVKFVRRFAPDPVLRLYGETVAPEAILAWLGDAEINESREKILNLFKSGKMKIALAQAPDDALRALANADWSLDLRAPILAMLRPEKFYWGPAGAPETAEARLKFAQANPGLLTVAAWNNLDGPNLLLPPSVLSLFAAGRYEAAIGEIERRVESGLILRATDYPDGFAGDDRDYALAVGRANGLNDSAINLIKNLSRLAAHVKSRRAEQGFHDLAPECDALEDYLNGILAGSVTWNPAALPILRDIGDRLEKINRGSSGPFRVLRAIYEYALLPGALIGLGFVIFHGLSLGAAGWKASSGFEAVVYAVCALIGLCGGCLGVVAGLAVAFALNSLIAGALAHAAELIWLLYAILALAGSLYYYDYRGKRGPRRAREERLEQIGILRRDLLDLPR